uniref:Uncharacterized protein n=1 Tax=Anguilla anguilla TaxID=7936 RepID=A0A0E9UW53_ANGAN
MDETMMSGWGMSNLMPKLLQQHFLHNQTVYADFFWGSVRVL